MEPMTPSMGKVNNGGPQVSPTHQQHNLGLLNLPPQGTRGTRPTILQQIPSSQALATPFNGLWPRLHRPVPPRATSAPQQRFPRLIFPRPGMLGNTIPRPIMSDDNIALKQDPVAGVQQITENLNNSLGAGTRGPRPTILQQIPSSQALATPFNGLWPRLHRPVPPRATSAPQQRFPRLIFPRPGMLGNTIPRPIMSGDNIALKQDPVAGVQQITENLNNSLGAGTRGPRPTILQQIPSSQALATPFNGLWPRLHRPVPPRATSAPHQRFPRLVLPRPGMSIIILPRPTMSESTDYDSDVDKLYVTKTKESTVPFSQSFKDNYSYNTSPENGMYNIIDHQGPSTSIATISYSLERNEQKSHHSSSFDRLNKNIDNAVQPIIALSSDNTSADENDQAFRKCVRRSSANLKYDADNFHKRFDVQESLLKKILDKLDSQESKGLGMVFNDNKDVDLKVIDNDEDLNILEVKLINNEAYRYAVIILLFRFVGNTLPETIRKIMQRPFNDQFLSKCSFVGFKGKHQFLTLHCCSIIHGNIYLINRYKCDILEMYSNLSRYIIKH